MKMAQQHLDLAYQIEEGSPSRSSSPEVNAAAMAAADQNRLNFAHEKLGESSDKGTVNIKTETLYLYTLNVIVYIECPSYKSVKKK